MVAQDLLHELFEYKNGDLIRKVRTAHCTHIGDVAGGLDTSRGYIRIRLNGKSHKAHRLIYTMHHGDIPKGLQIDHINCIKTDNRIENLRLVTSQENSFNTNAKGYTKRASGRYKASIRVDGKYINLGLFDKKEDAHQAYLEAKKELHIIKEKVA